MYQFDLILNKVYISFISKKDLLKVVYSNSLRCNHNRGLCTTVTNSSEKNMSAIFSNIISAGD